MVVVFSTEGLTPAERADATCVAMQEQSVPSTVEFVDRQNVRSLMDVVSYGQVSIFRNDMDGYRLVRSERQARAAPGEMMAIAVHHDCVAKQDQYGIQRDVRPDELMFMDLNTPYDYSQAGPGSAVCLHVPIDAVGLPGEVVRAAAGRLPASPLYDMVLNHIEDLVAGGDDLSAGAAAAAISESSIDLIRALLASAYDIAYARGPLAELMMPRIRAYVKQHLSDPGLCPASIATAHNISQRHLFKLCADADIRLEQLIIAERLAGARDDLVRPEMSTASISSIARRWGFVNSAHFSRRFRSMFGLTPRLWRQMNTEMPDA